MHFMRRLLTPLACVFDVFQFDVLETLMDTVMLYVSLTALFNFAPPHPPSHNQTHVLCIYSRSEVHGFLILQNIRLNSSRILWSWV